jgi:hypothetical protein
LSIRWRSNATFLGICLELLFERRELGKGRIRIRRLVMALPAFAAALEILCAQLGITIRPIAASGPFRMPVPPRTIAAIWAIAAKPILLRAIALAALLIAALLVAAILIAAILIGTAPAMPARPALLPRFRALHDLAAARRGLAGRGRGGPVSGSRRRCAGALEVVGPRMGARARRPAVTPRTFRAPQAPNLDELRFLSRGHRFGRVR